MMLNKIFRSSFVTSMVVLLMGICLIFGVLFDHFETQVFTELENEANYIAYAIKDGKEEFLSDFRDNNKRITIVSQDGTVLADTKADVSELENHSKRSEITEAIQKGSAQSARYSNTLMQKTLYYAKRLDDGTVLRVSATQNSVIRILLGLMQPVSAIVMLALILSLLLSARVSRAIIKPINELDLENPAANITYEELTPLLKKMSAQKKTIAHQIREANRKNEEFKLITENMSEGLLIIDKETKVIFKNRAAVGLLGIEDEKERGILVFNRSIGFIESVEDALSGKKAQKNISVGGGTYNLIANPVYENSEIIGVVIVIIDITESEKREQLRREFTSNVSHELKTPLTSISGFAEMLKSGGTPDATVVDFSKRIYDEAQRLTGLVGDIMKISELDEETAVFKKDNVNLYSLSEDIAKRLKPVADRENISLSVRGGEAVVYGAEKILDEMIYNLCDNAIKYNKEHGSVEIAVQGDNDKVRLTVSDGGIGIPIGEQSRVFERFYRVDKSRSKAVGGTGLGLAIVKHGAAYHNAEIFLESTENVGTKITLEFNKKNEL